MQRTLFMLTSFVDQWSGQGPAVIQWTHLNRASPPLPYADIIRDHADLAPHDREAAESASRHFLTREEASALGDYLRLVCPAWCANLRFGAIGLPMDAAEIVTIQPPDPGADTRTLSLLKAADSPAFASPVPYLGVVSRWPWPDLTPGDIAALIDMRYRLGIGEMSLDQAPEPDAPPHAESCPW